MLDSSGTPTEPERAAKDYCPEHQHDFFAHQDPRWLVCDCGQLAERTRTAHGQFAIRLIDKPPCAFPLPPRAESTRHRSL